MRVLVASHRFFVSGGPERYLFRVLELLERHGHAAVPFALAYARNEPSPYSQLFPSPPQGAEAVYYEQINASWGRRAAAAAAALYSPRIRRAAGRALREQRIDVVYALALGNWLYPEVVLAADELGIPVVWRLSDYQLLCPRYDLLRDGRPCELCLDSLAHAVRHRCNKGSLALSLLRVAAMTAQRAADVLDRVRCLAFPSRFTLERHMVLGLAGRRMAYLPPLAPPLDQASRQRPEHLLFVGNLLPHKGLDVVLRALRLLKNPLPLVVAGADLGAGAPEQAGVRYVGFVGQQELAELYRRARALLVPSLWYENAPNVILEAMAYGLPVIASDLGSLPELVEPGRSGLLARPNDPQHWAEQIEALLDDPARAAQMGEQGRAMLIERFDEQSHWRTLERLLQGESPS